MTDKRHIIIIRETIWESIITDIVSVITGFALMGVGSILSNTPMMWAGLIVWFTVIAATGIRKHIVKTIQEAREYLDELEK